MFAFLTPQAKGDPDRLQTPRAVADWVRQLPVSDVLGRQPHVMRLFDGMRQSDREVSLNRVAAIQFLDAALSTDRRLLITHYVENVESSVRSADRAWQAAHELSQGFAYAYQRSLEKGLANWANPRWNALIPQLFARLIYYHGTDAKLRAFRHERWIPAKWALLHDLFTRASGLGVHRIAAALPSARPGATAWSPEQEYAHVLLVQLLSNGTLFPGEIDWASARLREWCRKLLVTKVPGPPDGFFVDLAGKRGLVRRTGAESGPAIRYLDTTPLADQLERAIRALRQAGIEGASAASAANRQRVTVLEKVRPVVAPVPHGDLRRSPRTPMTVAANVHVGLVHICVELAPDGAAARARDASAGAEEIEVYAVAQGPQSRSRPPVANDAMSASIRSYADSAWQVRDRSVAGLRIAASGGIGQRLELGALVAVRQSDATARVLGAVRRLSKISNDDVEAGVSIIADRVIPVTVHAKRLAKDDLGMEVDGVDVSIMGARFAALYLPPPSRPERPLTLKTLIVPTSEYAEGRNIILTTGRSVYTIALRQLVEQRADWSWAAFQIVDKTPTAR